MRKTLPYHNLLLLQLTTPLWKVVWKLLIYSRNFKSKRSDEKERIIMRRRMRSCCYSENSIQEFGFEIWEMLIQESRNRFWNLEADPRSWLEKERKINLRRRDSELRRRNPDLRRRDPDLRRRDPDLRRRDADLRRISKIQEAKICEADPRSWLAVKVQWSAWDIWWKYSGFYLLASFFGTHWSLDKGCRSSERICSVKNVFVFSRSVPNICYLLSSSEQIIYPGRSKFFQKSLNFFLRTDRFSRKPPILLESS